MERIAVFARWPVPGRVKTRLTPSLPAPLACDMYRGMLSDALAAAAQSRALERHVYWDDAPADAERETPAGFSCRRQQGEDLGARLEHAFAELLVAPTDRALAIGADCPDLTGALLDQAFAAIETHDVTLGPSRDGGYYLIGLSRREASLFRDVAWGTGQVLGQTLERIQRAGLTTSTLPELEDIDTPDGLLRWIAASITASGRAGRSTAPGTTAALRAMKLLPG